MINGTIQKEDFTPQNLILQAYLHTQNLMSNQYVHFVS